MAARFIMFSYWPGKSRRGCARAKKKLQCQTGAVLSRPFWLSPTVARERILWGALNAPSKAVCEKQYITKKAQIKGNLGLRWVRRRIDSRSVPL